MSDFLLIHGSAHGAWCWRDLIPELTALGHNARAIDLPGHGQDGTPYAQVTLDGYADAIADALDTPAIVVGHSMGGYPITLAAERAPDMVQMLIYLCAYVPKPGLSLAQMRMEAPYQPLLPHIRMTPDRKGWTVPDDILHDRFYHDCPPGTVEFAAANLCIQATQPTSVPVTVTERSSHIPRRYIRCSEDRTIPPEYQVTMTRDWPADHVVTMDCSHSPFFAKPRDLAAILHDFAKGQARPG
ncbi:Lysophospholipase, alpha-beta hydrolase superfamily [Lutimaribacter pacificus]|uniref:Lysophospholipase, alpha-beta hydrolase superfamily n=1 Tax=Lutimaribacter pacificus TaxID=391948 RepID=A0A1H0CW70_9RHOB|nr:alpha/beta fold hydrolase [Lutimaribacter pacificus]SDN62157.1 Lysophospholipase, alpha-beta hydrolase superfamily [Lutimaribacter pacificus]SHJ39950.1 Lysophospholipase, alpha-beta hydrolase superfamily [Lutimaribacter pacificus]